ncbi:hypothetical protein [Nocardioides convexus]|uniref:hypothetical protein n=1 Tax=Nocardioides convexus TaxID=2712224 RepID=UPI0024181986|nr:hypothetical protein [Nocardioides convexus]
MTTAVTFEGSGLGQWTEDQVFEVTAERIAEYAAATNDPIEAHLKGESRLAGVRGRAHLLLDGARRAGGGPRRPADEVWSTASRTSTSTGRSGRATY